jgi:hypothetical protein
MKTVSSTWKAGHDTLSVSSKETRSGMIPYKKGSRFMAPRDACLGFQDDILNGNSDAGQDHILILIPIFQPLRFFHVNLP